MVIRPIGSPRRIALIFLVLVLAPSVLLVALGWQLFKEDRDNARQQLHERRQQTADLVESKLEQGLAATEQLLGDPAAIRRITERGDAVVLDVGGDRQQVVAGRLAFLPVPAPGRDVPAAAFESADQLWNRGLKDQARATYRDLLNASDPAVRAGALLRLSWGAPPDEQLRLFDQLRAIENVSIEGVPVGLFAAIARCEALLGLGRAAALRTAASTIRDELVAGRWSISRRVHDANLQDVRRWAGTDDQRGPSPASEVLASAIDIWWQSPDRQVRAARRYFGEVQVTLTWTGNAEHRRLLAALPSFAEREWLAPARSIAASRNAVIKVGDADVRTASLAEERRPAGETGLPWTLWVSDADAAGELARLAGTRSLWLAGLAALVVVLGAGAYLVTRAIGRELAVARLQSDFVAAVSHEFRTPLTSMRQLTEILVDERVTDGRRLHAYYQALARQTDRLHRLVESLLDLGRLETGQSPYRLEPLDACALVRTVVEDFTHDTADRGVRIELDLDGAALPVAGDKDALTNALWNLLDNAVKYSPDRRTAWVSVQPERGRLLIRVRDEGIGIPKEEQRTVFDKFVRGARAKADGFKGTGIGLSMVRHIVLAHGGDVAVQSEPGTGSTFTLALPLLAPGSSQLSTNS